MGEERFIALSRTVRSCLSICFPSSGEGIVTVFRGIDTAIGETLVNLGASQSVSPVSEAFSRRLLARADVSD